MFIDARRLPANETIETDVCIVGAGAAGITLAREFIDQPFRVCLLESGGFEFDKVTQSLYAGKNRGLPYLPLQESRTRYFGGTTNRWTGWCRPLDELDFQTRDWIPHSGWPFGKSHLEPFYKQAQSICQLGPYKYDPERWETHTLLPLSHNRLATRIFQFSPPTRFGTAYRDEISRAANINAILYANVIEIETNVTAQQVTHLNVATLAGNRFFVKARIFILAAGGIENARLLMLSDKVQSTGLGNQNDLIGRFFMEHPYLFSGVLVPANSHIPLDLYAIQHINKPGFSRKIAGALSLTERVLRSEKLVNSAVYFAWRPAYKTSKAFASQGMVSLLHLLNAIRYKSLPDGFARHLKHTLTDIDDIAVIFWRKMVESLKPVAQLALRTCIEPAPNPNSRVTLSSKRDYLGQNQVELNWQLSEIDLRSLRRLHQILRQEIDQAGLGQIHTTFDEDKNDWPPSLTGGSHHMGTTRMHLDPKQGVVDENCKVHGISNLFVAGSSVFPTAGYANPTLTIVALAIRLADHVKNCMIRSN